MRLGAFVGLIPIIALLALWQITVAAHLYPPVLLPPPAKVAGAFALYGQSIVTNTLASVTRVLIGVGLAFCVAVPSGLRVGVGAALADYWLVRRLPAFAAANAGMEVELTIGNIGAEWPASVGEGICTDYSISVVPHDDTEDDLEDYDDEDEVKNEDATVEKLIEDDGVDDDEIGAGEDADENEDDADEPEDADDEV